ncbi:hypothetical protein [Lysobacter silvisoli]|uniref:hypothetical protein n=1 Tax=Lysobacter silvisoli TaxID=2293254 RepID=UPI0018C89C97|nr:hypothetical protein [Lysobacter silvisoli]
MSATTAAAPARKRKSLPWRYRGAVAVRAFAAVVAGYLLAYASTAFLTVVLPFSRSDRVVAASLLCFAVWCYAAMHAFAAKSAWRALWTLLLAAAALYAVAWAFPGYAARP